MQILVRNIDRNVAEEDLREAFQEFGQVSACDLVMDQKTGGSKGFGFVEMPETGEAMKAIEKLDRVKLGSSILRVKRAANSTVIKHRR